MLNYMLPCYVCKNITKAQYIYLIIYTIVNIPFSPAEATYMSSLLCDLINAGKHFEDIIKVPSIPSYTGKMRIDVSANMSHKISTLSLPELCIHITFRFHSPFIYMIYLIFFITLLNNFRFRES